MEASPNLERTKMPTYMAATLAAVAFSGCTDIPGSQSADVNCATNRAVLSPEDEALKIQIPTEDIQTVTIRNNGEGFTLTAQPTSPEIPSVSSEYNNDGHAERRIGNSVVRVTSRPAQTRPLIDAMLTICSDQK